MQGCFGNGKVRAERDVRSRTADRRPNAKTPQGSLAAAFLSEPTLGFEPRTYALRKHCSTAELSRQLRRTYVVKPFTVAGKIGRLEQGKRARKRCSPFTNDIPVPAH